MFPHVLLVRHWVIKAIIDDVCRQVAGSFSGVRDDGVEVYLEVKKADFLGAGVVFVGEFIATNCQANMMRFRLGELDVADKVGIDYFFVFGDGVSGDKNMVLFQSMFLDGIRDLPQPCAKQKNSFAVEISLVAFSGQDQRVLREDLSPVVVLITVEVVEMSGRG